MTLIYSGYTQYAGDDGKPKFVVANAITEHEVFLRGLDFLAVDIHRDNVKAGWWSKLTEGAKEDLLHTRNRAEMLMLAVTELDEAMDAHETGAKDDKITHRQGFDVELADCAIRVLDLIGAEQRRGGKQPLMVAHPGRPTLRVDDMIRVYHEDRRGTYGDVFRIVSDLSKALDEGYRKDKVSLGRYHITAALFRMLAYAHVEHIPLFEIIEEKRDFNRNRADHKIENRLKEGGKKC